MLRGGENKGPFFSFFVSQQPPGVSAIKRLADGATVKSEHMNNCLEITLCPPYLLCRLAHRSEKSSFDSFC